MKKLKQLAHLGFLCGFVLALSACQTVNGVVDDIKYMDFSDMMKPNTNIDNNGLLEDGCPKAEVVAELGTLTEFTDNTNPKSQNMVSHARIAQVQSKCQYTAQSVTVDLKIMFEGNLGPAGRLNGSKPFFAYPFFVAVTSPMGSILAKEVFANSVTYEHGQDQLTSYETMRQIIPISNKDAGKGYKILVGFQLLPEQLEHNRAVIAEQNSILKMPTAIKRPGAVKKEAAVATTNQVKPGDKIVVPDTMASPDQPETAERAHQHRTD